MTLLSLILQGALACILVLLALLSLQLAVLALIRHFAPPRAVRLPDLPDEALPEVLVQLPVCDEGNLPVRIAAAAARLDWPADRLHIQVLDDGPAEHHEALARAIYHEVPKGICVSVLRRGERRGFKAGNLAFGLNHSQAPYVAIFDADFVPPSDFLRRTVPALMADPELAFVQARWGHANRFRNWLTRVQGVLLDSHFAVEQEARFRAGLPIAFNGTAGVWRRDAIDDAGGWSGDTLTEDLDLSLRAALRGWRAAMISDLEAPGELPETAAAWRAQQARWTKGHVQVALKLFPEIWGSAMPLWKKALVSLQICQCAFYSLAAASAVISLILMWMGVIYLPTVAALGSLVTVLGLGASLSYLYTGQVKLRRGRTSKLFRSIILAIVFPSGLIIANARATFEALANKQTVFARTPKAGAMIAGGWRGIPELAAGVVLPAFAFTEQAWSAPFFVFAVSGLISIGFMGWNNAAAAVRKIVPGE